MNPTVLFFHFAVRSRPCSYGSRLAAMLPSGIDNCEPPPAINVVRTKWPAEDGRLEIDRISNSPSPGKGPVKEMEIISTGAPYFSTDAPCSAESPAKSPAKEIETIGKGASSPAKGLMEIIGKSSKDDRVKIEIIGNGADVVEHQLQELKRRTAQFNAGPLRRLQDLDLFILDNSIRESTVGQLRQHTLEDKIAIFKEVKKCGLTDIVIARFSRPDKVDDDFCKYLKSQGEDFNYLWAFAEVSDYANPAGFDMMKVPISVQKNKDYGLVNIIFEIDLTRDPVEWDTRWTALDTFKLLASLIEQHRERCCCPQRTMGGRIMVNFRDFSNAMTLAPHRVLEIVAALSSLPREQRVFGIMYEDLGSSLPEELGFWTASVRKVMEKCGWSDGNLLFHVHQEWDFMQAAVMECLLNGANGIWASLCDEGAAMGHASSTITTMNLVRLGNKNVLRRYNCVAMRQAAINVTRTTTGKDPSPRQVLYGERALDSVFGFALYTPREFDVAKFYGIEPVVRMNTLVSPEMIQNKLMTMFGPLEEFTMMRAQIMQQVMISNLRQGRREEYMSRVGMALLFQRAGGQLTDRMVVAINTCDLGSKHHKSLIEGIRKMWDRWAMTDACHPTNWNKINYDNFYTSVMARYFRGQYSSIVDDALAILDVDKDQCIDWEEFQVYLRWTLAEYPDLSTTEDVLDATFNKGLIPAVFFQREKNKGPVSVSPPPGENCVQTVAGF